MKTPEQTGPSRWAVCSFWLWFVQIDIAKIWLDIAKFYVVVKSAFSSSCGLPPL